VLSARPDVLGHNVEIVPALYPQVRPQADYRRSLELLQRAKEASAMTKTGLMLGLGEGTDDVISVMEDLRRVGCDMLTLGQYLQPSKKHLPVIKYYEPEEFASLKAHADRLKFYRVVAGPLVRSSYHAEQNFLA
jgi:lipoic acid synthetase